MTSKVTFSNFSCGSIAVESSWKAEKEGLQKDSCCQTSDELYEFDEAETQTALSEDKETQNTKVRGHPVVIYG